jgi:hypothetical protein
VEKVGGIKIVMKRGASMAICLFQGVMIVGCMVLLKGTESYYVPYFIVYLVSLIALICNRNHTQKNNLNVIFTLIFCIMITLSNYKIWYTSENYNYVERIIMVALLLGGNWRAFKNIFGWISCNLNKIVWKKYDYKHSPMTISVVCFIIICAVNLTIFLACQYPGNLTVDGLSQVLQGIDNNYTNHHPFYHTLIIKLFVSIGLRLYGDVNVGVALYNIFQIVLMAFCFSYILMTVMQIRAPKVLVGIMISFYVFMPYHIMYSFTVWKDVIFSGFVVLFAVSAYRCLADIGRRIVNSIILIIGGVGFCLLRSNGLFSFALVTLGVMLIFGKGEHRMLVICLSLVCVGFIMKHIVLSNIGVSQPDIIESLSIPLQQVSRVIADDRYLTEREKERISAVMPIDEVANSYESYISDPIKDLIRTKGNKEVIMDKKLRYLRIYITLGIRNPDSYLEAWIDETKGYWNGGYKYWRWADYIPNNDIGLHKSVKSEAVHEIYSKYLSSFEDNPILQIFLCIGFYVWINILCVYIGLKRKDRISTFVSLVPLAIIVSLLVSTPVFAEFRYAYPIFCLLPFVIVVAIRPSIKCEICE